MPDNYFELIRGEEFLPKLVEFRSNHPNLLIIEVEAVGNAKSTPPAGLSFTAQMFRPRNGDFLHNPNKGTLDITGDTTVLDFRNTISVNRPSLANVSFQELKTQSSVPLNPYPGKMFFVLAVVDEASLRQSILSTFGAEDVKNKMQQELLKVYNNRLEITDRMAGECYDLFLYSIAQEDFATQVCRLAD